MAGAVSLHVEVEDMARDARTVESQDFHLTGLLLIISAAALGLVLTVTILLLESDRRAVRQAALAASTVAQPVPAEPAPQSPPAALPGSGWPASEAKAALGPAAAGDGSALFASSCGGCHPNGGAGLGPSLKGLAADVISQATRDGKGAMPAFKPDRLSDQQLRDIVAFLGAAS